jgi:hypothetical protein
MTGAMIVKIRQLPATLKTIATSAKCPTWLFGTVPTKLPRRCCASLLVEFMYLA